MGASKPVMVRRFMRRLKTLEAWLGAGPAWRIPVLLTLLFGAIHALYFAAGLQMTDLTSLSWDWHFIDEFLLRNRPIESLFYLHTQPPVQNTLLALFLQLPEQIRPYVFPLIYTCFGLVFYFSLYRIMVSLGVAGALALLLSTAFIASPSFVLLEYSAAYDFPVAAMTALSALLLLRFLRSMTFRKGFAFFGALCVLCLTRSLFHLVFLVIVIVLLCVQYRRYARTILLSAGIPLLLTFSWYAKNYVVFGKFTASTWMGMNASKLISRSTSGEQRAAWVQEGVCSGIMLIEPWSDLSSYPHVYSEVDRRFAGIPVLNEPVKSSGYKNLHHAGYIAVADQYFTDVISIARRYPGSYLKGYAASWFCYFRATDESSFLPLAANFRGLIAFYDYVFYGKSPWPISFKTDRKDAYNFYVFLLLGLPLLFWYGIRLTRKESDLDTADRTLVLYLLFTIAFIALVINAFELAENQRARFYSDGFSLILFAHFLQAKVAGRWLKPGVPGLQEP